MQKYFLLAFFAVLLLAPLGLKYSFADTWYPGEGLKQGDYFRYNVCFTDWHNCSPLEIDFWVQNQTSDGNWNLQFLAIDGSIIQKGVVTIGTVTPDPVSFSPNVSDYASVYKNTIIWLDAFSTKLDAKDFSAPAWGKSGSVGGQSVGPVGQQQVTVPAGSYKAWVIGWHKGVDNKIWVVPSMPFPVKAQVYADVTNGSPPPQFLIELLETGNSQIQPEFLNKASTGPIQGGNCPANDTTSVHKSINTDTGSMIIEYRYTPAVPHQGCPIQWSLYFEKPFDPGQRYSSIQYDIFTVDDQGRKIGSAAEGLGKSALFAPVGEDFRTTVINQPPPVTHYVVYVAGVGSQGTPPDTSLYGLVKIDIQTAQPLGPLPTNPNPPMQVSVNIPNGSSINGSNLTFDPKDTWVTPSSTVTWTNNDKVPHTVTSGTPQAGPDNKFDSGLIKAGQKFSFTFKDSGTYNYFCQVHPWMTGSIIVDANAVPEFPMSSLIILSLVVAIGVLFTKFRTNLSPKF